MLRRRIFSSAMASVMALSSIAVVANAEDTNKEYITKEDLKAYVDSLASFRDNDLYDYGSISGEKFLDAIEYAENVINGADYDNDDATVAYQMLKEVKAKLVIYTADELQALINSCTADYERNNVLNEELSDAIYGETEFGVFEDKYEMALVDVESGDSRLITDTYEELKAAYDAMVASKLATVTKSDFTAAIKALEKAMMKEKTVSQWRYGSIGYWSNFLDAYIANKDGQGYWWINSAATSTWNFCWQEVIDYMKGVVADYSVYENYDVLIDIKSTNETSNTAIVDACTAAKEVAATINAWTPDNTNRGSKANVAKLLDKYNGALVNMFMADEASDLFVDLFETVTAAGGKLELNGRVNEFAKEEMNVTTTAYPTDLFIVDTTGGDSPKTIDATIKLRADKDFFIKLDVNGKATGFAATEAEAGENFKKVSKGVKIDLCDYVYLDPAVVANDWDHKVCWGSDIESTVLDLGNLLKLIYEYQNKDYASSNEYFRKLVTIDEVTAGSEKGSTAEWTLIYRALQYWINFTFGTDAAEGNTKADLEKLIELTYEIEARTSEAAIFADAIEDMVKVRQFANDWLKAANADKKYRDNISAYAIVGFNSDKAAIADTMYDALYAEYETLLNDEAAFAYSYGEIYDYIAVVAEGLETNDIKDEKGKVAELLKATSYYLSVVKTPHEDLDDAAFSDDRDFIAYNRVLTDADGHTISYKGEAVAVPANGDHAALKAAYEMLKAAVEADKTPAYEKGDVNKDKKVDLKDALATLKAANGGATVEVELGDMNSNGKIDLQDALAILKKANA